MCPACGSTHNDQECRAIGKKCYNCGGFGHLASRCPSAKRNQDHSIETKKDQKVNLVTDLTKEEQDSEEEYNYDLDPEYVF